MSKHSINTDEIRKAIGKLEQIESSYANYSKKINSAYGTLKKYNSNARIHSAIQNIESSGHEYDKHWDDIGLLKNYLEKVVTTNETAVVTAKNAITSKSSFEDLFKYGPKDAFKKMGYVGKAYGLFEKLRKKDIKEKVKAIKDFRNLFKDVLKDYKNYRKIGRAIGGGKASWYFFKKVVGLRNVGYASKAKKAGARFVNNLKNKTSPFNLKDAFAPLTGGKGVKEAVGAWAGVLTSGVLNFFSNRDEQKESDGQMSDGRVVAETISETVIDTVVTYGASAVVGAAITAVTGTVAAPVVVAVATGAALAAVDAGIKSLTGKSATEFASDLILDTAVSVGKGITSGVKSVGNWFKKASFAFG